MNNKSIDYNTYDELMGREDNRHKNRIKKMKDMLREFQKTCNHPNNLVRYYPDPSGNNDSYNMCWNCGCQW